MNKVKLSDTFLLLFVLIMVSVFGQQNIEPLIRINEEEFLERGVKTGYVNMAGDTIKQVKN